MHKKSTILILFFSIFINSLLGMEADSVDSEVSPLDKLPNEVIVNIVDKMIPYVTFLSESKFYQAINATLGFLSTSKNNAAFEVEISNSIKSKSSRRLIKDTLAFAIEKHNFRVARILIAAGGILKFNRFIMDESDHLFEKDNLIKIRLFGQLLKFMHKVNIPMGCVIEWHDDSAIGYIMNPPYSRYLLGKMPRKLLIKPVKFFLNAIDDNEAVLDTIVSAKTSLGKGLFFAISTHESKFVSLILKSINKYPSIAKKILEEQDTDRSNFNAIMYATIMGHDKAIRKILELGRRVQSIHLTQKSENGKSALDFADDEETKEFIKEYLHK